MSEMITRAYQVCTRCVMDTSDKEICFDINGICNHCHLYDRIVKPFILSPEDKAKKMNLLIGDIKEAGKGRKYDCIIGISGGLDSSYVAYLAWKHGLKAILVHFDNGWDSELAVKNIENIVNKTGFDYYNYIVDWEEFRDLQLSYFKSSVVDVEVPTDQGIFSLIPKLAVQFKTKYHLFGSNPETETTMGSNWNYPDKMDRDNLEQIHKRFGSIPLKTFPKLKKTDQFFYDCLGVKKINLLEFSNCDYPTIKSVLKQSFNWKDYGVKHGESTFTRFYQSYYLPKKFGFDKRRAHLSDQINSGHIRREDALVELGISVYSNSIEEENELRYVANKLKISPNQMNEYIVAPNKPHQFYNENLEKNGFFNPIWSLFWRFVAKIGRLIGSLGK